MAVVLASGATCAWAMSPVGAAAAAPYHTKAPTGQDLRLPGTIEPQVCASCSPPLQLGGGPVMDTNGADGLTITPIWWQPSGGRFKFPALYEDLLNQYVHDIAAASGTTDNIYSILTEYYEMSGGLKKYISYKFTTGTPLVDTDPFPANGCKRAPAFRRALPTPSYGPR